MRILAHCVAPAIALAATAVTPHPTYAQRPPDPDAVGTLIVAHGASAEWNAGVESLARSVRTGGPVEIAYLMGDWARTHRFQDAAARLEAVGARLIVVVPVLVSSFSGHYDQIRYLAGQTDSLDHVMRHHLHESGIERARVKAPIRVTPAIDDSPELARVLGDHARAMATTPREQALFLLGHGPNDAEEYARWMERLRPIGDSIRLHAGFRDVRMDLVRDDAPRVVRAEAVRRVRELIELQHQVTGRDVVVIPVLISSGSLSRDQIPADLQGLP